MPEGNVFTSVCLSTGELDIPGPMEGGGGYAWSRVPVTCLEDGHVWSRVTSEGMGMPGTLLEGTSPWKYPLEGTPPGGTPLDGTRYSPQKVHPRC